ncbi:TBC1 domain family member 20 [Toxorhynchites rutilus septentrionalis]|uniref:TBC1 domain family member 20 n=1 Tax=Toxorhynchites rutilus septentrionalis TaxID=329112 RepID=UPI0024793057|nr:TBC1 domain family member 20 [Toxorhynchites rutilus septentrionalis]
MERVELLNGSSSSSAEDHNKSLTSIEADYSIEEFCDENSRLVELGNSRESNKHNGKTEVPAKNMENNVFGHSNNNRRADEPTELSFEKFPENHEEKLKRIKIENALDDSTTTQDEWREFAKSEYGLINDDLRRKVWPLLVGVNPKKVDPAPSLEELNSHPEYNQVVLDVNRSLKRFPPGIPYEQRVALQDQLTVLILRVIMKYPHLKYYQGYHDVAITFLLVVGEEVAFHVMEILSTNHLVECMQETMEPTQKRLMFIYPLIRRENPALCTYLERSTVGTLFALPWYLTWFGHSLNSYRSVVRLYDYFLASDFLLPIYVTSAIVLYRQNEIFQEDCDMASLHCLLSQLPEDLPFEYLLKSAEELYRKYSPKSIEKDVENMIIQEKQQRLKEERERERRKAYGVAKPGHHSIIGRIMPHLQLTRRSVFVTTAFSILVGFCAYYYRTHFMPIR